jgi:hypothetical protein
MHFARWTFLAIAHLASGNPSAQAQPPSTLSDCLNSKNVPIRLISSPDFAQRSRPFNLRLQYTPAVIVLPTTVKHVSDAVVCASQNGVKVQAKCGGHSYASYSFGGRDGIMTIDLESFQEISLDANFVAKVGGGVRLGNLAYTIFNQNNSRRALSHGTCPGVGIGGHATHGGFGYSSRNWGLALDSITAMDVVLANGSSIRTTRTSYPDIFYAFRGAADSFGVVTSFYMATKPAPATVIQFRFSFPDMYTSATKAANAFLHIQKFALNSTVIDRKIGFGMYLDGRVFRVYGTYFGTLANFNDKIRPELLRGLPAPRATTVQSFSWIESLRDLAGGTDLQQPLTGYNVTDDFFAKSITTPADAPLTSAALTSFFDYIIKNDAKIPYGRWWSIINLYGGPDSQINARAASSSAYSGRDSLWVFQNYGYTSAPTPPSTIIPYLNGLNDALISAQPQTNFGAYVNYVDPSLTAAQAHRLYYDAPTYARLSAIKRVVDPQKVFWNPQAIGN